MSMFNVFDIAGSALSAQTLRLNLTASNIANADSVSSSDNRTYRARHPVFQTTLNDFDLAFDGSEHAGVGVRVSGVVESEAPLRKEYRPDHPQSDLDGYIYRPNVNVVEEMANMISASRTFQTNVEIMNASKQMLQRVLSLGR